MIGLRAASFLYTSIFVTIEKKAASKGGFGIWNHYRMVNMRVKIFLTPSLKGRISLLLL